MQETATLALTKIIHDLASVKKQSRDQALGSLQDHLSRHGQDMSELDFAKLWQGLFYCYWLTDKEYVQHQVARYMARLIHVIPETKKQTSAFRFMRTFFTSIVEYWVKVDMHRVAKYLSLIRYLLHESFVFLRDTCHYEHINRFNAIMRDGPLKVHRGKHIASLAVMTHMIDIFVQEAEKVFARNENSKMYAMDEEIDYDNADIKMKAVDSELKKKQKKEKVKDVDVITSENMMLLLEPFIEAYATSTIDSILISFDKTMWRQLEEYKDPNMDMVQAVKREKQLAKHKKGAYVVAGLFHLQEYARPAKGSLDLNLNTLSAKFLEQSKLKTTRNKARCIKWHNAFASATLSLHINRSNDPLDLFKQELSDVAQRNEDKKKKKIEKDDEDDDEDEEEDSEESGEQIEEDDDHSMDDDDEAEVSDEEDNAEESFIDQQSLLKIAKALKEKKIKESKSKKRVSFELSRNEIKSYIPTLAPKPGRQLKNALMKPKKVKNKAKKRAQKKGGNR